MESTRWSIDGKGYVSLGPCEAVLGGPQKGLHLLVDPGGEMASHIQLLLGVSEWRDSLLWKIGELWLHRLPFSLPVLVSDLQVGLPVDGYGADEGVLCDEVGPRPEAGRNRREEDSWVDGGCDVPGEGRHGSDFFVVW